MTNENNTESNVKTVPSTKVAEMVKIRFEGQKMIVSVDTNKDGEPSLEFHANLAETADEVMDRFLKQVGMNKIKIIDIIIKIIPYFKKLIIFILKKKITKTLIAKLLGVGLSGPLGFVVSYLVDNFYEQMEKLTEYLVINITYKFEKKRGREFVHRMHKAVEERNYDDINEVGRDILNS